MMADAVTGKFKVIVADSNSRISRMDEWDFFRNHRSPASQSWSHYQHGRGRPFGLG